MKTTRKKIIATSLAMLAFLLLSFFPGIKNPAKAADSSDADPYPVTTLTTEQASDTTEFYRNAAATAPLTAAEQEEIADEAMTAATSITGTSSDKACKFGFGNLTLDAFIGCILSFIMRLITLLLQVAAVIFNAMIDPTIVKNTLNAPAVYQLWAFVRDFINMFFILVLLFSAFATIFQISKYNFKNILFKLILAAFLVNFSFTITRVVIDVSNIAFYSFVQLFYGQSTNGNAMLLAATDASSLADVLVPDSFPNNATQFGAIISFFLLAISFLALGVLLLLRLIFLVIVIIFSPLAFISAALSNAGGFFTKWSNMLLKYSFFGPIMMFFFYVGIQFTWVLNGVGSESMLETAQRNIGSGETGPGFIASMVIALVPVVVIWLGMGVASQLSIAGADATMGKAQKLAKWAGNLPGRGIKGGAKMGWEATGVPGGVKQKYADIKGGFERGRKRQEARVAERLGVTGAVESNMKLEAEEYKKKQYNKAKLKGMAKKGDLAAAYRLAEDGNIDSDQYEAAMKATGSGKGSVNLRATLESKTREKRADTLIKYRIKQAGMENNEDEVTKVTNEELSKLDASDWQKQNIEELVYDGRKRDDKGVITNEGTINPGRVAGAKKTYEENYDKKGQERILNNMKGDKYAAGVGKIWGI